MSEDKPAGNLFDKIISIIQGIGKPKDATVLRAKPAAGEGTSAPVSSDMDAAKLARVSNNRLTPLEEKVTPGKEQWQKLKQTAKANDPGETNIDHWNQKQGGILSGTTFDAATTNISNTQRKRPSVVTQARITNHRLQALQTQMEKPKNDIDQVDDSDHMPGGH